MSAPFETHIDVLCVFGDRVGDPCVDLLRVETVDGLHRSRTEVEHRLDKEQLKDLASRERRGSRSPLTRIGEDGVHVHMKTANRRRVLLTVILFVEGDRFERLAALSASRSVRILDVHRSPPQTVGILLVSVHRADCQRLVESVRKDRPGESGSFTIALTGEAVVGVTYRRR